MLLVKELHICENEKIVIKLPKEIEVEDEVIEYGKKDAYHATIPLLYVLLKEILYLQEEIDDLNAELEKREKK